MNRAAVAVTGLSLTCGSALGQASTPSGEKELKADGSLTTYVNNSGDIGVLAGLKLESGGDFRLRLLADKPSNEELFSGTGKLGLNLEVKGFELNAGAGLKDGDMDFSRFAFGYRNEKREGLRITYDSTPLKDQLMLDGRIDLTEHITAQGIVDDSGNFRIRGLLHDGPNSLSIAGGKSGDEAVFNVSANTDKLWVSGSYSESRGIQGRLVLGDIPKNRSDLYGGVDIPGANDISLFPDQTVKPTIGSKPTFGMLALAPHTFLSQDPGSMVLDISGQENQRISARGALRLEDLGPAKNPWIAAGTYYDLTSEKIGFTIEAGAKALGGEIRLMTEFKEGTAPVVGVLYQVKF